MRKKVLGKDLEFKKINKEDYIMKCPDCNQEIKNINIFSQCRQEGIVNSSGKITEIGNVEEILDTALIEHRDNNCFADITNLIEE